MSVIETHDLTKKYANDFLALDSLDLSIEEGEVFGYIGPNGAGKTTTIRILCGLLKPTSGQAMIADHNVSRHPRAVRKLAGYLPDSFGVYEEMRVWEYLDFFGACFKVPKKTRRERLENVLDITQSAAMRDYFVDTLSHGMRQRIGIAKTLMHDPQVLFLDEPTNGLDPRGRIEMRSLIQRLAEMGKTVLVSSHILPELATVADRVGIIEHGRLLAAGTVAEIMSQIRPNRMIQMRFLSDPDEAVKVANELLEQNTIFQAELVEDVLQFEVSGDDSILASVLKYFITSGVEVAWYEEQEADLEEAFMKVTDSSKAPGTRQDVETA